MVTAHIGPGLRASVRTLGEEYAQARPNILPDNHDYSTYPCCTFYPGTFLAKIPIIILKLQEDINLISLIFPLPQSAWED